MPTLSTTLVPIWLRGYQRSWVTFDVNFRAGPINERAKPNLATSTITGREMTMAARPVSNGPLPNRPADGGFTFLG